MEPAPDVTVFFDSYRRAFERFDASAIADHFAYPGHVTSDGGESTLLSVVTKDAWIGTLEHVLAMYRAIGFHSARALSMTLTELSPRLVQALVHWELHDAAGHALYDFHATYTLGRVADSLRISAIAHNEVPRYRACLARLLAPRAPGERA